MTNEPQTWHYGLVARWWAEFNVDGPEIPYFQKVIERNGQPALDVACGTGRLLLPYLRAGLDVDGCDFSPDMLALCREKAASEGLAPRLYEQAMHKLDLPRTYRTIFACGSIGLGGDRRMDLEALRRFYRHLEPGGVLAFDHGLPYGDTRQWQYWLSENRSALPEEWGAPGERRRASDGTELALRSRVVNLDPLEQVLTLQIHAEQWRDGESVAQEERTLKECLYFKNEMLMMLEGAGFGEVAVYGGYSEVAATVEDSWLVFVARK
jgi:SAM-dependent methyltransferase